MIKYLIKVICVFILSGSISYAANGIQGSCASKIGFGKNISFTIGIPHESNTPWQSDDKNEPCFYKCTNGYSGPTCKNLTEENACFKILVEKVKTTNFPSGSKFLDAKGNIIDLKAGVLKNETSQEKVSLGTYDLFLGQTVVNPRQHLRAQGKDSTKDVDLQKAYYDKYHGYNVFAAKRNIVGVLEFQGDTVVSQYTTFGYKTNFSYPSPSENVGYEDGDPYPYVSNSILFTLHNIVDGEFLSCGMYQLTPKKKNIDGNPDYLSIADSKYKTDVFENSGFEFESNDIDNSKRPKGELPIQNKCRVKSLMGTPGYSTYCLDGKEFLVGKVSIGSNDYGDNPFFDANVLTVAYNNHSKNFDEFETFPYQVKAMTNPDMVNQGIFGVVQQFRNSVKTNTCLKSVRPFGDIYPDFCGGVAKSLSFLHTIINNQEKTFSFLKGLFFPQAFAKLGNDISPQEEQIISQHAEKARGLILFDGVPLEVINKIKSIQDTALRDSLLSSVALGVDKIIKYKKENGLPLSNYEEVFSSCNMSYNQRVKNVLAFISKIKDPSKINYDNLEYIDPKFGDCIIPFPDKRHLDKEIPESFPSNKYLARVKMNKGIDNMVIDNKAEISDLINQKIQLENQYNAKMQAFEKQIESGIYVQDINTKINAEKQEYDKNSASINKKIEELTNGINQDEKIKKENNDKNKAIESGYSNPMIIVLILGIIGLMFVFIGLRKRKK